MTFQFWVSIFTRMFLFSAALLLLTSAASAQSPAAMAAREYNRLVKLSKDLEKIPADRYDKEPHRSFIRRNRRDIVYSEPAGQWFVRADRFWSLQKKYAKLPIADDIAWSAAETPLPGECEGYVNCYISRLRSTYGEYLRLYPNGRYSKEAVERMVEYSQPMAGDEYTNYNGPESRADKRTLKKMIAEMRGILNKAAPASKAKALEQLAVIETRFA